MDTAGRSGFVALNTFYKSAKPTAGFFVPAGGRRPDFISTQFFLPDFMRSSAWNEFFRPAGIDGALLNVLRDRDEIVGLYHCTDMVACGLGARLILIFCGRPYRTSPTASKAPGR
jgi:hypothetical protein